MGPKATEIDTPARPAADLCVLAAMSANLCVLAHFHIRSAKNRKHSRDYSMNKRNDYRTKASDNRDQRRNRQATEEQFMLNQHNEKNDMK